jgi:hypothetical protein
MELSNQIPGFPVIRVAKKTILTLAVLCCIGLMFACKSGITNDKTILLGEWQTVSVDALWVDELDKTKGRTSTDTAWASLIGLNFIDTSYVIVKCHTRGCDDTLPYPVHVATSAYMINENYLWTSLSGDYEIMKLSDDILVLRCYCDDEQIHAMETYTLKRK